MKDPQRLFAALADPTRRAVYEHLTEEGSASATSLAARLPVSRQAIAKHLTALDEAGLVERSTVGREVRYSARLEPLSGVTDWVSQVGASWEERLAKLKRSLG